MRTVIVSTLIAAGISFCGIRPAAGASAYDDVPSEHWAYPALEYLRCTGVLEGYPDNFFDDGRLLTRYEFAQAVARLCDSIELRHPDKLDDVVTEDLDRAKDGTPEDVEALARKLRKEFWDQLRELGIY